MLAVQSPSQVPFDRAGSEVSRAGREVPPVCSLLASFGTFSPRTKIIKNLNLTKCCRATNMRTTSYFLHVLFELHCSVVRAIVLSYQLQLILQLSPAPFARHSSLKQELSAFVQQEKRLATKFAVPSATVEGRALAPRAK